MKKIKIAFFGNPKISVMALKSLLNDSDFEVVVVVTNEDKPIGRSHSKLQESEVFKLAKLNNLNIIKTNSINKDIDKLKKYNFDFIVTCAFGQFLSDSVLNLAKIKPLNIHGSLLPEGRGGAPIHWAIINGNKKTGITIMEMISKMDAGNYYSKYELNISDNETSDSLFEKMGNLIFEKTAIGIKEVYNGKKSIKQDESKVSFWLNIKKEDSKINFNYSSLAIDRKIRGLTSKPGAWMNFNNKIIKINKAIISDDNIKNKEPGTILNIDDNGLLIKTKDGSILIKEITIEGKKKKKVSKSDESFFKINYKII